MGHTYSNNLFHIIYSTKGRQGILADRIRDEFHRYTTGIVKNLDCSLIRINSVVDHAHLLCKVKPSISVSDFVNKAKTNSSRWINDRFELPYKFQWQNGFSCFSVSETACESVIRYIDNQQEHHQLVTFEEELKTFLEKHGIDYDPERFLD